MKKQRILILLEAFSEGGAQHMVYELVKCLDTERFDLSVLCYGAPSGSALERQMESVCKVTFLNRPGSVSPKTIFGVLRGIQEQKPDVVHAHLGGVGFGAVWALLTRKRFVVTAHTKPEEAFSPKVEKMVRLALKTGKTTLVAVSRENEVLLRPYFKVDGEQIECVNNGIDLTRFCRTEHENFTLINVARHDENKNQAALIRCFARLHEKYPQTKLLLLGDGPTHQKLMDQITQLGLNAAVTFTGNVPNTQDYYAVSDLYVQCSHREAMPLSVLEAMAAGLPIVSTNVGGLSDVVRDNGLLVLDDDENALYHAIEEIYTQAPERTEAMCRASRRIVQDYSSQSMARAYERIYNAK